MRSGLKDWLERVWHKIQSFHPLQRQWTVLLLHCFPRLSC